MMEQLRKEGARPPPPPLDGSVGAAYLDGKLSAAEVAAEAVPADDVRSLRNMADGTCAQPQEASAASVVNGPLASAPDIAIAAAGAETQEKKPADTQEEQEENQEKKQENQENNQELKQEDEAMPQCIKCLRDVDMELIETYQVMSSASCAIGSARNVKVKCNLCNKKEAQLRRQYGSWPPKSFFLLDAAGTAEFWKDCGDKGVDSAVRVHLVRKRLNEDLQKYGGSYAPMGVLVKLGHDEELVREHCLDTWTDPEQVWLGVQYRIKALTMSTEERLLRGEKILDGLKDELGAKRRAGAGGKKKRGKTEQEEESEAGDDSSEESLPAKEQTKEEKKNKEAEKKLEAKKAEKAKAAADRLAEKKRQKDADDLAKAEAKEDQKRQKFDKDQSKKNKADGVKIMLVLKPCMAQVEREMKTAGFASIEACIREPVEKRLAEVKAVVAEIVLASLEPSCTTPPWTLAKAKEQGKKAVTMAKSAASFTA